MSPSLPEEEIAVRKGEDRHVDPPGDDDNPAIRANRGVDGRSFYPGGHPYGPADPRARSTSSSG